MGRSDEGSSPLTMPAERNLGRSDEGSLQNAQAPNRLDTTGRSDEGQLAERNLGRSDGGPLQNTQAPNGLDTTGRNDGGPPQNTQPSCELDTTDPCRDSAEDSSFPPSQPRGVTADGSEERSPPLSASIDDQHPSLPTTQPPSEIATTDPPQPSLPIDDQNPSSTFDDGDEEWRPDNDEESKTSQPEELEELEATQLEGQQQQQVQLDESEEAPRTPDTGEEAQSGEAADTPTDEPDYLAFKGRNILQYIENVLRLGVVTHCKKTNHALSPWLFTVAYDNDTELTLSLQEITPLLRPDDPDSFTRFKNKWKLLKKRYEIIRRAHAGVVQDPRGPETVGRVLRFAPTPDLIMRVFNIQRMSTLNKAALLKKVKDDALLLHPDKTSLDESGSPSSPPPL